MRFKLEFDGSKHATKIRGLKLVPLRVFPRSDAPQASDPWREFADLNFCDCSLQAGQQHQHAEEWNEDRSHACEEEAAQSVPSPRAGAEEEEGETLTSAHLPEGLRR